MNPLQARNQDPVQWLVVCLFLLGLSGCSLEKRTTLPGWHWEHQKTAIQRGPISNAETFLKDRGRLVNLPSRGARLQSEIDLSRTLQVSAYTSLPKRHVEAMTVLLPSEMNEVHQPSMLVRSSVDLDKNSESGTIDKEPNEWLVAALITLGFGLMVLPSPFAGVLIGLAPFIFSLGQLVRPSRMKETEKKKGQGKTFAYILLMLASVFVTIGLTSFLAFSAVVDAAEGSGWSFSWNYTGPG